MINQVCDADRDDVLFAFHRYVSNPTPFEVSWWTRHFPQFADDIRGHAVEVIDMNFRTEVAEPSAVATATVSTSGFIVRDCACCSDRPTIPPDCPACHGAGGFTRYQIGDGAFAKTVTQVPPTATSREGVARIIDPGAFYFGNPDYYGPNIDLAWYSSAQRVALAKADAIFAAQPGGKVSR